MTVLSWETLPIEEPYTAPNKARLSVIRGRRATKISAHPEGASLRYWSTSTPQFTLSYDEIGDHNYFALSGNVNEEYPTTTDLIDLGHGLKVQLSEEGTELESPSLNNALNNELLIFAGDVAFGTAQEVTDAYLTADDLHRSAETSEITLAGSPAAGDVVWFQAYRNATNGSDTLAADARLLGVIILYSTNTPTDD